MGLVVGVLRELEPGERRVALVPKVIDTLAKSGISVVVETGAGDEAGFPDSQYAARGARIASDASAVCEEANLLPMVRALAIPKINSRHTVMGFCDPLGDARTVTAFAQSGATLLSMELIPRITRAQSMDALSSMATIAGYKAVLLAAAQMPRMLPMLTTAAGTIPPARVLVMGAGVAGLQAIATARRLGAVVVGYDVRPEVREQVESLGAKFLELDLDTKAASGEGGYAKALDEAFYRRQRDLMTAAIKDFDVVITTAAVPGKKAPVLVTAGMVREMAPGSVIVDLAAERGGNCELTRPGETVIENGVSVIGPVNLPASVPHHASLMYGRNVVTLIGHLVSKGELVINPADEITGQILVTRGGEVVHPRVRQTLMAEVKG